MPSVPSTATTRRTGAGYALPRSMYRT
jgi:hypothetical protein